MRIKLSTALAVTTTGYAVFVAAVVADGHVSDSELRAVGILAAVMGTLWLIRAHLAECVTRMRAGEQAIWEHGRRFGEDQGYRKGRKTARPVVVPIRAHTEPVDPPPAESIAP